MENAVGLLSRKKYIDLTSPSNLKRCLGTMDLTALGEHEHIPGSNIYKYLLLCICIYPQVKEFST